MVLVKRVVSYMQVLSFRVYAVALASVMALTGFVVAGGEAMATESAAESSVKTLAEKIGSEGVAIFLIIVTAITALLAIIVAVTLGLKKLKSFAK